LIERFDCPFFMCSEPFDDPAALLRAYEEHGLEGIVSKLADAPYRSGRSKAWVKTKYEG
jgi:bifunctional non-homologous end joining protein LigD